MDFIDRDATHSTPFAFRPINGIVVHGTEGHGPVTTHQSLGGWHWLIGRGPGELYRDCSEDQAAWHVQNCDRWRPPWVLDCPTGQVSAVNYSSIGIELVSDQAYRDAGEPFTPEQYETFRALATDLTARYGPLPFVGHGQLQPDRSDPVRFDWTRAGLGEPESGGRYFLGDQDMGRISELEQALAAMTSERDQLNGVAATLDGMHKNCERLKQEVEGELRTELERVNGAAARDSLRVQRAAEIGRAIQPARLAVKSRQAWGREMAAWSPR